MFRHSIKKVDVLVMLSQMVLEYNHSTTFEKQSSLQGVDTVHLKKKMK